MTDARHGAQIILNAFIIFYYKSLFKLPMRAVNFNLMNVSCWPTTISLIYYFRYKYAYKWKYFKFNI